MKILAAISQPGRVNPDAVVFWTTMCLTLAAWLLLPSA